MDPVVGRIVHFSQRARDSEDSELPLAALITRVHDKGTVNLCIFELEGATSTASLVEYDEGGKPFSWRWPPKEA